MHNIRMMFCVANNAAQEGATTASTPLVLPYITLGSTAGVEREYVGHFDDGVSHAIHVPNGFPFGHSILSSVYVRVTIGTHELMYIFSGLIPKVTLSLALLMLHTMLLHQ